MSSAMTMPMHTMSHYSAPSDYDTQQYINPAAYDFAQHNPNVMMQQHQHNVIMPAHVSITTNQNNYAATAAAATVSATSTTTLTSTLSAYFKLNTRDYEKSHEKTNNPCTLTLRVGDRYCYLPVKTHESKSYKKRGTALATEMACDKITFDERGQYSVAVNASSTALPPSRRTTHGDTANAYSHDRGAPYSPASSTSGESAATAQSPLPASRYHLSDNSSVDTNDNDMNAIMTDDNAATNNGAFAAEEFFNFTETAYNNAVHLSTPSREELLQLLGKDTRYTNDIQSYSQAYMVYIRTLGGSRTAKCWFALQQQNWYKITLPIDNEEFINNNNINLSSIISLYYSVYKPVGELAKGIFKTKSTMFKEEELSENSPYTVLSGVGNGNLARVCKDLNIETLADLAAYNSPLMPNRHQLIPQQKFINLAVQAMDFLKNRHKILDHALKLELKDITGRLHDSYSSSSELDDSNMPPLLGDPSTPTPATNAVEAVVQEEPPELAYDVFYRLKENGVMSFPRQDDHDNDLTTWTDSVFKDCWNTFRLFPYQKTTVTGIKNPDADYYIKRNDFIAHAAHIFGRFETQRRPIESRHIQTLWTLATLPWPMKDNLTFSTFFRMFCFLHTRLSPDDFSTPIIGLGDLLEFLTYHLNFIKGWSEDHDLPLFCSRHEAEHDLNQDPGMFYRLRFCEGRIDRFVNDAASTPREQRVPVYRQLVVSFRRCLPVDERSTNKNKITWFDNEYVHHLIIDPASVSEMNSVSGPTANGLILRLLDIDGVTLQNNLNFLNRPEHIVRIARIRGLEKIQENQRRAETGAVIGRKEKKQQQGGYVQRRSPKSNALPTPQPAMAAPPLALMQTNEDLSRKRQRGIAGVTDLSIDAGTVYSAQTEPQVIIQSHTPAPHTFSNASQWSMDSQPNSMATTPSSHNSYDQLHDFTALQQQRPMNNFNAHNAYATAFTAANRPRSLQSTPHYLDPAQHGFQSQFPPNMYAMQQQRMQQIVGTPQSYPFVNGHLMQPIDMAGLTIHDQQ